jgi:carbon storage regulator CsrA
MIKTTDGMIVITILPERYKQNKKLGIDAPEKVKIWREELYNKIPQSNGGAV